VIWQAEQQDIYKQEGLRGFWKGNFSSCFGVIPYAAVQFGVYSWLRDKWADSRTGTISLPKSILAAAAAGRVPSLLRS
jgi:hypothetical protein